MNEIGMTLVAAMIGGMMVVAGGITPVTPTSPGPSEDPTDFLRMLTGEWSVISEATLGPGQDPVRTESVESARMLGERWLVAESTRRAGDRTFTSILTLGYNPHEERFIGTWIDSLQDHLWQYTGTLDASGTALWLETEGPIMGDPTTTARYREVIEIVDTDHKVMRSMILGPDGEWFEFGRAEYRRVEQEAR